MNNVKKHLKAISLKYQDKYYVNPFVKVTNSIYNHKNKAGITTL